MKKNFLSKKSHSAKKCKIGDPSGFENIQSVANYQKIRGGDPLGTSGFVGYVKSFVCFGKVSAALNPENPEENWSRN